jgi:hypothetical protein
MQKVCHSWHPVPLKKHTHFVIPNHKNTVGILVYRLIFIDFEAKVISYIRYSCTTTMEPDSPRRVSCQPPRTGPYKQYRHSLSNAQCSTVTRYLLLGWKCKAIATECGISSRSVYRIQENLMRYGSAHYRALWRAKKLSKADEEALFEYLLHEGWRQQDIGYGTREKLISTSLQSVDSSKDANGQGSTSSAFRSTEVKFYVVVILMISVNFQRRILSS